MMMTVLPWFHPKPRESQVQLDVVPSGVIDALARGEAQSIAPGTYRRISWGQIA